LTVNLTGQPTAPEPSARPPGSGTAAARRGGLLAVFLFCAGVGLGALLGSRSARLAAAPADTSGLEEITGPWGTLEIKRITIERPNAFISVAQRTRTNVWFFEGCTPVRLKALFEQPDLMAAQQNALLDASRWQTSSNGIYVTPGSETILSLSPAARERLYAVLAPNTFNYYQRFPFSIRAPMVEEWFAGCGLAPETQRLVRGLLYRRGDAWCFSDMLEALSCIPSPDEKRRVAKMFSRQATLLVKLRVPEGANVEPLVQYWGRLGQAKDIQPMLESLARTPGGATLDIAHLLTPFARSRLYTYPFPSEDPLVNRHDCFWTSMNFANAEPDDRFTQFDEVRRTIQRDYYPVQDDPEFGDVVWFIDSRSNVVHSAVYIAADFFFTKNGANFNEPWFLMILDDLLNTYAAQAPLRTVAYRFKR